MESKNYHSCVCMHHDPLWISSNMIVGSVSQPCRALAWVGLWCCQKSRFYAFYIDLSSFVSVFFSWIYKFLIVASHFSLCILVSLPCKVLAYLSLHIWKTGYPKTKPNLSVKLAAASSWDTLWKNFAQDILVAKDLHALKKEVDKNIALIY